MEQHILEEMVTKAALNLLDIVSTSTTTITAALD